MVTLGIETSEAIGSLAVVRDGRCAARRVLDQTGRRHARTLVSEIKSLLASCDLATRDIDLVAVSIGPGSFTGLRVGVVCAKTLAYALGKPIVGIDTYLAIAAAGCGDASRVQVVGDALRGDLCVTRYVLQDGEWRRCGDLRLVPADEWLAALDTGDLLSGPAIDALESRLPAGCRLAPRESRSPSAETIARLGETRALSGSMDDVWSLAPRYFRRSAAEEQAGSQPSGPSRQS